ncbi:hypothetical protein [Micromonospora sp. NPDC047074]|uniref:hypothetical protein n=1 Tax=Micromonospora sp. NPDC047074 TaxID=3154339 RepID=UPI0033C77CA6
MKQAGHPWWQVAKTPRQGFILGGIWLLVALTHGLAAIGEPIGWRLVLGGLTALLGACYVVTALLLRQRQRSGQ